MKNRIPNEFEIYQKLKLTEGYKITQKINTFYLSTYIFKENYTQLATYFNIQTNPKKSQEIHFSENREELRKIQLETLRFLHNFLAAAQSLIDHTRNFVNELYDENELFKDEFSKKIDETFTNNEIAVFIKSFRQYLQHYKAPNISTVTNLQMIEGKFERKVMISIEDLLKFSGWRSLAKKFILKHEKNIDLQFVTREYYSTVNDFYSWFSDRQNQIHKKEFDEMEKYRLQMIDAHIESTIRNFIKNKEYSKEIFDNEITEVMGDFEKKAFSNFDIESKFKYVMSICRNKKIVLKHNEILIFRKRYCR